MSRTVWKVVIDAKEPSPQTFQLPFAAKPVHVDRDPAQWGDNSKVAVWFECNPDAEQCGIHLWIVGTGHHIPDGPQHIGSVVHPPFAWHVYMGKAVGNDQ